MVGTTVDAFYSYLFLLIFKTIALKTLLYAIILSIIYIFISIIL
jgi:hypothetical protein